MRRPLPLLPAFALTLAFAVLSAPLLSACSEDGATADCPTVPLYDIGAAGERNDAEPARKAAVAAGCMTDIDKPGSGSAP
jgi:hypothetical protein